MRGLFTAIALGVVAGQACATGGEAQRRTTGPDAPLPHEAESSSRVLAPDEEAPCSITFDAANVYWLAGMPERRTVRKVDRRKRSRATTLVAAPHAVDLVRGGPMVYWSVPAADRSTRTSETVPLEIHGAAVTAGKPSVVVAKQRFLVATRAAAVAADAGGLAVLVAAEPAVLFVPHGDPEGRVIASGEGASPRGHSDRSALGAPVLDVVASNGEEIAWAGLGTVRAVAKAGGAPRELASLRSEPEGTSADVVALAMDREAVYAGSVANDRMGTPAAITRYPLRGGPARVLAQHATAAAKDGCDGRARIAVDATHVYWTRPCAGSVVRVAKQGGVLETVASGQAEPCAIAVTDGDVLWTNHGTALRGHRDGSVVSFRKQP